MQIRIIEEAKDYDLDDDVENTNGNRQAGSYGIYMAESLIRQGLGDPRKRKMIQTCQSLEEEARSKQRFS
jgi:hypothetical protein